MAYFLAPSADARPQFFDAQGNVLAGGLMYWYLAGTTTPKDTFTTSAGAVANSNPITLDSAGRPSTGIYLEEGTSYKLVVKDSAGNTIFTQDNIVGIATAASTSEWAASGLTATYISATQFSVPGDQTTDLHVGRRVKVVDAGGTKYGTIADTAFTSLTTVTVVVDSSGSLASPITSLSLSILRSVNPSVPGLTYAGDVAILSASGTLRGASAAPIPINLALSASVGSNALTIAIKGRDGNNPSPSNPVLIPYRSATAANGDYSWLTLTSAASFVMSSGSTGGARDGIPFRFWIVSFNDAGTQRLGIINCVTSVAGVGAGSDVTQIYPLKGWGLASSSAEGGAGAADSAQVFYTGTAVSSKAYTVLGYATFEAGLATAGTYASVPTRLQRWMPGMPLPGDVIQTARNDTGAVATGTTTMPQDDSIPQQS